MARTIDGRFRIGPLAGKSVNIKFYGKQQGVLDLSLGTPPDYYLVLTGERCIVQKSAGTTRPLCIEGVYLFESAAIHADLQTRSRHIGIGSSVRNSLWDSAEVYPRANSPEFALSVEQMVLLRMFAEKSDQDTSHD